MAQRRRVDGTPRRQVDRLREPALVHAQVAEPHLARTPDPGDGALHRRLEVPLGAGEIAARVPGPPRQRQGAGASFVVPRGASGQLGEAQRAREVAVVVRDPARHLQRAGTGAATDRLARVSPGGVEVDGGQLGAGSLHQGIPSLRSRGSDLRRRGRFGLHPQDLGVQGLRVRRGRDPQVVGQAGPHLGVGRQRRRRPTECHVPAHQRSQGRLVVAIVIEPPRREGHRTDGIARDEGGLGGQQAGGGDRPLRRLPRAVEPAGLLLGDQRPAHQVQGHRGGKPRRRGHRRPRPTARRPRSHPGAPGGRASRRGGRSRRRAAGADPHRATPAGG